MFKRILPVILSVSMVLSSITLFPAAAAARDSGTDLNTVCGAAYLRGDNKSEGIDRFYYSDDMFKENSLYHNDSLATASIDLCGASNATIREDEYAKKIRNLTAFLEDNGFTGFEANEDYKTESKSADAVAGAVSGNSGNITVNWTGSGKADRYVVSLRQKGSGSKSFRIVSGETRSCVMKDNKKGKVYSFRVTAQKEAGNSYKTISESRIGYVIAGNVKGKYTNPKAVKLNLSSARLNKNEKFKLRAKVTKVKSGKKLLKYTSAVRYFTTDKTVASISSKGVIKAVGSGSCRIYAQTVNGVWKRVNITVN